MAALRVPLGPSHPSCAVNSPLAPVATEAHAPPGSSSLPFSSILNLRVKDPAFLAAFHPAMGPVASTLWQ